MDPTFYSYLERQTDGMDLIFCHRWLLLYVKKNAINNMCQFERVDHFLTLRNEVDVGEEEKINNIKFESFRVTNNYLSLKKLE